MTRIIAGRAGSLPLEVPTEGTRPTSDRVRESLFGALESADALVGAAVCDLYAGSGALGLEALSRGAASAELVEKSPGAAAAAQRNAMRVLKTLDGGVRARVHCMTVQAYLASARGPFDLVFLDPPYNLGETELTNALAAAAALLAPEGIIVVERARRSPEPDWRTAGLHALRARAYGDTTLWWGQTHAEGRDGS